MPILNPQQAYNLLKKEIDSCSLLKDFSVFLLQKASIHYMSNRFSLDIYFKFYNFLFNNMNKCFDFFGFTEEDAIKFGELNKKNINIYECLHEIMQSKKQRQTPEIYQLIELDFAGYVKNSIKSEYVNIPDKKSFFFIPFYNSMFGCFVCTEGYVVFTFNINFQDDNNNFFAIQLITFLFKASGYKVVSCISDKNNIYTIPTVLDLNSFSETHIFTELDLNDVNDFQNKKFQNKEVGYVYIYAHFKKKTKKFQHFLEEMNNEYVKVFIFSKHVNKKNEYTQKIDSIFYAPNSVRIINKNFDPSSSIVEYIDPGLTINLCNVALYKQRDDITPHSISEIGYGTIISSDFNIPSMLKIPIQVDNDTYFIDYEELHFLNPELYIKDPMYLSKENFDTTVVERIENSYQNQTNVIERTKAKSSKISSNIEEKMHNAFHYLHKYTTYKKNKEIRHLEPYTSQIFAVYKTISYLSECDGNEKGIILQVHTGEGKSYIIQALAEHLARQGNIVHIATSNIILAARDFMKSYNYFVNCERKASNGVSKQYKPSILIHQNELTHIDKYLKGDICKDIPEKELFYSDECFNNPTNMNITVCRNDKRINSNIVYSTFLNFEAYFLSEHEKDPYFVSNIINKSYLIIDEADSILIDELSNGTILSKPMKSNATEVLELVYDIYTKNTTVKEHLLNFNNPEYVLGVVKDQFKECYDMTVNDIQKMFSDIDKVRDEKFKDKYVIAEDLSDPSITKVYPYDSEHKGIIELNKEFNGFVHQFVGINEKKENSKINENLEIQPLTLNYQFISHPTYVKMYRGICGVTGTLGSEREKNILRTYYGLTTSEVPRHQMCLRKDLPMIICQNIEERNRIIFEETLNFHKNGYPVLVVFLRVNEINDFEKELVEKYHIDKEKYILKFTGKNKKKRKKKKSDKNKHKKSDKEKIEKKKTDDEIDDEVDNDHKKKSDKFKLENESGLSYKITIGSNFCGRGIDIKFHEKPLCVIVSYYKEDQRSTNQVLGRAGRNGYPGMARIICTREDYVEGAKTPEEKAMKMVIKEFKVKNDMQAQFINDISMKYPWLFNESEFKKRLEKEKLPKEKALALRQCLLNINRITAYNFKFPVCMSVETFLNIQIQRIFSLKNCPECKYTWNLFRIYMRELILESWSLFLESTDKKFKSYAIENSIDINDDGDKYNEFFDEHYENFLNTLFQYIPSSENNSIINTFLHIVNIVIMQWNERILKSIPEGFQNKHLVKARSKSYTSFHFGFFPLILSENSGCRLTPLTPELQLKSDKGNLYIVDPELKYIKKNTKEPFSITLVIDKIFEKFQEVADRKLQGLFGIRFFLRRTLCGCEFGVCVDTEYESCDDYLNCLFDRNPILMFTICTKSTFIWIGGILIVVLVFFTSLCATLASKYLDPGNILPSALNFGKKILMKILKFDDIENEENEQPKWVQMLNLGFDKIIEFLREKIDSNLNFYSDNGIQFIIKIIMDLFISNDYEKLDEKLNDLTYSRLKINDKIKKYLNGNTPFSKMIVVGVLIIVYLVTFVMNFKHKKSVKFNKYSEDNASSYQKQDKSTPDLDLTKYDAYKKVNQTIETINFESNNESNNELNNESDDESYYEYTSD